LEYATRTRVLHAEATGQGYYIIVDKSPQLANVTALEEQLKTKEISIVPAGTFTYAYVGLADARGQLLDVGIIHAVEFRQRYVSVITKLQTISPVRIIQFGQMRVKPDGTELAKLRPGEI
jgi:polynucleotide 5'-kinase involved in rRNA processing